MRKGQYNLAVTGLILVAIAVIGLNVVNDMVTPYCKTGTKTCEAFSGTNASYTDLYHEIIYSGTETVYNTTGCTGSTIADANYTMNYTDGGIILASDDGGWTGWDQSITYDYYEFGSGIFSGLLATVICYIPLLFALGTLVLGGYLLYAR